MNQSCAGVRILFEDNHVLVAEKPVGVLSQADYSSAPDMLSLLKQDIKRRYNKPGKVFLGLVHRLDRNVGGVMVFARTSKAAARLCAQFRARSVQKEYWAVVAAGNVAAMTLQDRIDKIPGQNRSRVVCPAEAGRDATLSLQPLERRQGLTLLTVSLESGRPHQIRLQLSAAGMPLVGDLKYGGTAVRTGTPALWCVRLSLTHPTLLHRQVFVSRPPPVYPWDRFAGSLT